MASLLQYSLSQATPISGIAPWIALVAFLYVAYEAFVKKESKFVELLTTNKILVPIFMLVGMALVPSSVVALFGIVEPVVTAIVQIVTGVLFAILLNAGVAWLIKTFTEYF